ncbi:MAG: 3'-5' exonuclease [Desulfobacteraceae bacterium]|jgi:DNA polymerase III epsilon subunit-like protein
MEDIIFLDTETTGLDPYCDTIIEIGIVDGHGDILLDTLIDPCMSIPKNATQVNGITDDMIKNKPLRAQVIPIIIDICTDKHVVIYNADFDIEFLPEIKNVASKISCCMIKFARYYGEWSNYYQDFKWQKLDFAADYVKHQQENGHRAVDDAIACRAVWNYLETQPISKKVANVLERRLMWTADPNKNEFRCEIPYTYSEGISISTSMDTMWIWKAFRGPDIEVVTGKDSKLQAAIAAALNVLYQENIDIETLPHLDDDDIDIF